jgi:cellulose biosynthesis protein BcsQ
MPIISFWSDKGGTGKSMLSAMAASWQWSQPVVVVDLDPQGDAVRWAKRAGVPFRNPCSPEDAAEVLQKLSIDHLVVVDCPPGRLRDQRMAGVGVLLADALIIPGGSGRPDLDALGRAIRAIDEVREKGAMLKAGVVLNHYRETTRSRVVEEGLKLAKLPLLGRLSERAAFPEAFSDGKSLISLGGAAAHEAKTLWTNIESWLNEF